MKISTWRQFAKVTIETNDLDPTYVFLHAAKAEKGDDWATKFALHYLCFYDLGEAVMAADTVEQADFWKYVKTHFPKFKRGTERRHTRGPQGEAYIHELSKKGTPLEIWDRMYSPTYSGMVHRFKEEFQGCGFGHYFLWKVLDFQERIWERKITLSLAEAAKYCPDAPRKCALILWPGMEFEGVIEVVADYIYEFPAPPGGNRMCSYQEAETILCMLKGYFITKSHTIGDDIDSKWDQLKNFPAYLQYLPPKQDWTQYERAALAS